MLLGLILIGLETSSEVKHRVLEDNEGLIRSSSWDGCGGGGWEEVYGDGGWEEVCGGRGWEEVWPASPWGSIGRLNRA